MQAQPAARKRVQAQPAGRTSPLLCAAIWRRSFLWEVGTSYNERRLLWEVGTLCLSCNLRKDSPAPAALARRGRACGFNPPTCAACEVPMGSDASYNERRLLWAAVRFVQAVTGVRAGQPAFMPRLANTAGAGVSMGSDALRLGCNLHEGNPARQGGRGCRLSLPGQPAFMRAYRIRGARRFLWEVIHSIISGGFYGKSVRFVWAVTCMRTAPRPPYWRGAAWVQAQPAARKSMQAQPARFQARLPHPRRAKDSYGR